MARVLSAIINGREWRHPGRAQQLDTTTKLGIHCEAVPLPVAQCEPS